MESYFLDDDNGQSIESLDLRRYYRALLRKWWLIASIATLLIVPWVWYLKQQPPVYEAYSIIQFNNFAGGTEELARMREIRLKGRDFAMRVVSELGLSMELLQTSDSLMNRRDVFKVFRTNDRPVNGEYSLQLSSHDYSLYIADQDDTDRLHLLKQGFIEEITDNPCEINGLTFQLNSPDIAGSFPEIRFKIKRFRKAVESFQSIINSRWEDAGALLTLRLSANDPILAADMTNRLADIFIEESRGVSSSQNSKATELLREQLENAKRELEKAQEDWKRFRGTYTADISVRQKQLTQELLTLETNEENLGKTISDIRGLLDRRDREILSGKSDDYEYRTVRMIMNQVVSHPMFEGSTNMLLHKNALKGLEEQWVEITNSYAPQHPSARQTLLDIKAVHEEIITTVNDELLELGQDLEEVKSDIRQLSREQTALPAAEIRLGDLQQDMKTKENLYRDILGKYVEVGTKVDETKSEEIVVIEPAIPPEIPTESGKKQKAAFGGIFGLFLGVGVVLAIEFMDKSLKTVDDVRRYTRLNVIGTIPQLDFNDVYDFNDSEKIKRIDSQLVTHDFAPTPIGEAYRSLRTNLMFSKDHGQVRSLVLTSNEPGDGKSFTAANLAITLAQLKTSTLLIDADLRRGVLHNTFGVAKEPGFSNYLTDVVPLQSILQETQIPNLTLISCGSLIPNPSELLGSHQMQRFLDEVRRKFELIVFDTPPLNAATDAVVVGTQVDAAVVVIRAGKTDRDLAKSKLDLFSSVPAKVLGAILNGTTADMAHPGYSYYHY